MPYIKPHYRPDIDKLVAPLAQHIAGLPLEKQDGAFNYAVTKLLKALYAKDDYFTYNRSMGALSAVQAEWYRRVIVPYEDEKIKENGDVA
jgi:hypothetical protein